MRKHAFTIFTIVWPILVVTIFFSARGWFDARQGIASSADLQKLLNANRYQLTIPIENDGYFLKLTPMVNGVSQPSSSASVIGGSQITLLVQGGCQPHIHYAWFGGGINMAGTCHNPFRDAATTTHRSAANVKPGDWLIRGGDDSVSMTGPAKYELLVTLSPPAVTSGD